MGLSSIAQPSSKWNSSDPIRLRIVILGLVQGVGFRPFVHGLATALELVGYVQNTPSGLLVEVEGLPEQVDVFARRLPVECPPMAVLQSVESWELECAHASDFVIRESLVTGEKLAGIVPDLAVCPACLQELFDPGDRRHRYPFINCTHCGPRYSIIESIPYDRPHTTMRNFQMCTACRAEYENPADRRFHAQPNACPECGPQLAWWDAHGRELETRHDALRAAVEALHRGDAVAVKGLGGFHLLVDATNQGAVDRLRTRKHRGEKPFAVMYPDLPSLRNDVCVTEDEAAVLPSPAAPIVLARRTGEGRVSEHVAPGNPRLGVMLPYTPLHHLLLRELSTPVVATSGNLSEEPICTDEKEAVVRLRGIADFFLVHNRPIARHVDDSVVCTMAGRQQVLRRARGYAPLPVPLGEVVEPALAVGGHLKNSVALASGSNAYVSQYVGDLENSVAYTVFEQVCEDLQALHGATATSVARDEHPDYSSTRYADRMNMPVVGVQHHHAHIVSCMMEQDLRGQVLGIAWDGTGYGTDGSVWGGEFLVASREDFQRFAHLGTFRLPGGETALREPRRSALGLMHAFSGGQLDAMDDLPFYQAFSDEERQAMSRMTERGVNAPLTSSVGRLFDAVASLLGLSQVADFEGQAAMLLEFAAGSSDHQEAYLMPVAHASSGGLVVDWGPMVEAIHRDLRKGRDPAWIALKFHRGLAEAIVDVAHVARQPDVVLSGGCFQNVLLTELAISRLQEEGFNVYWHQRVPANDGGLCLGQLGVLLARQPSAQGAQGTPSSLSVKKER